MPNFVGPEQAHHLIGHPVNQARANFFHREPVMLTNGKTFNTTCPFLICIITCGLKAKCC